MAACLCCACAAGPTSSCAPCASSRPARACRQSAKRAARCRAERLASGSSSSMRPSCGPRASAPRKQAHADVDVDAELSTEALPPPRFAPPFRPVPTRTVVNAARSAIATGMGNAWRPVGFKHNAAAMSPRARLALHRQLSGDRDLARFAQLASDPIGAPVRRRRHHAVSTDVR